MKILLTGSNARQCGTAKINPNKAFDANNLRDALSSFSTVDMCMVDKDIAFDDYDIVVSGFGSMGSFTYPYVLGALYAIGRAKHPIVYLEDWKCTSAISGGLASIYKAGYDNFLETVYNKQINGKNPDGTSKKIYFYKIDGLDPETVWTGIERMIGKSKTCQFLMLGFNWGDKKIFSDLINADVKNLFWFDESQYIIKKFNIQDVPYDPNRMKKFFCAGLSIQDKWLKKMGIKDITDCFGMPPYPRLPNEIEVNKKHHEYLGLAVPEYKHAGSGWSRLRYIYGAMAKNIFMLGDKDAEALGIERVRNFDDYSADQLKDIAMHTYETIKKYMPTSIDESNEWLKSHIDDAISKFNG